mmetsp:Transcript_45118/g.175060  ORF Transcript_45118/g.175060 Transcript_45118/m.175060 type:complete len:138 (+) Transcript_45118:61-474(+)
MALVGTNSFALLQDDVEDADENSVNKEALVTEKKPASAPAKDTKPAAKDEKATQKRGSGSARGRGRGRGNNDRADYEQGPPMKVEGEKSRFLLPSWVVRPHMFTNNLDPFSPIKSCRVLVNIETHGTLIAVTIHQVE